MLLDNIQPTKGLGNGTMGVMHSLSFGGEVPEALAAAQAADVYACIELDDPPHSINFVPTLPKGDDWRGIQNLVDETDLLVVPIVSSTRKREHRCSSLYSAFVGIPKLLQFTGHLITLA